MFRRKRRKFRGIWLPPDPYDTVVAGKTTPITNPSQNIIKFSRLDMPNAVGLGANVSIPLVGDWNEQNIPGQAPAGAGYPQASLADLATGYSLRRVVGKLFLSVEQDNVTQEAAGAWVVTAGLIVRRVNNAGEPVEVDQFADAYESARDPWLWRRNWLLQNSGATAAGGWQQHIWPGANWNYHSVADGPHVDAKTRRTVKAEERLYMSISAITLDGTDDQTVTSLYAVWDFRFFGRTFTAAGNRGNAAR